MASHDEILHSIENMLRNFDILRAEVDSLMRRPTPSDGRSRRRSPSPLSGTSSGSSDSSEGSPSVGRRRNSSRRREIHHHSRGRRTTNEGHGQRSRERTRSRSPRAGASGESRSWADRMESDSFERPDYSSQLEWSDEEPEVRTDSTLMEVSEETKGSSWTNA